jgi:hypothetical protein
VSTPNDDYNLEVAAAEAAHEAATQAASAEQAATQAVVDAAHEVVTEQLDSLTTHQHSADQSFLRITTVGGERAARKGALVTETKDRTEADSLEKRDRKNEDQVLADFSGADPARHDTDAGTSLTGARYRLVDKSPDAPIISGNSLELASTRNWRQLKHFQIDTTRFINSDFVNRPFPLIPISQVYDENFITLCSGDFSSTTTILTAVSADVRAAANSDFTNRQIARFADATGNVGPGLGAPSNLSRRYGGLIWQINNAPTRPPGGGPPPDALPWDNTTKANAIIAIGQIPCIPATYANHGNAVPYSGTITVSDQKFVYEVTFEFGSVEEEIGGGDGVNRVTVKNEVDCTIRFSGPTTGHDTATATGFGEVRDDNAIDLPTYPLAIAKALAEADDVFHLGVVYDMQDILEWDSVTKANATAVARSLLPSIDANGNYVKGPYWGILGDPNRSGTLTVNGMTFSWATSLTTPGFTVPNYLRANVTISGPTVQIPTVGDCETNYFETLSAGTVAAVCHVLTPDYFAGINATTPDFEPLRLSRDGVNYFWVNFSGVFDSHATVWYRVLDSAPPVASTSDKPWKIAADVGKAFRDAVDATIWPTPYAFHSASFSKIVAVTAASGKFVEFGVNALSAKDATRPATPPSIDSRGRIFGARLAVRALNVPVTQAPVSY